MDQDQSQPLLRHTDDEHTDSDHEVPYEAEIVQDEDDFSEKEDSEWYSRWLASNRRPSNSVLVEDHATTSSLRTPKSSNPNDSPDAEKDSDDDDDEDKPLSHFASMNTINPRTPPTSLPSPVVYAAAFTPPFDYKRPPSPPETAPSALPAILAATNAASAAASPSTPNVRTPLITNPSATFNTGYYHSTPTGSNHPFYQEQRMMQRQQQQEAQQPRRSNEAGEDDDEDDGEDGGRLCCGRCSCVSILCCLCCCLA